MLAIIPCKGAAAQLIRDTGIGLVSDSEDVKKTMENIKALYKNWVNNDITFAPDRAKIAGYERKILTARLADVFDKLVQPG